MLGFAALGELALGQPPVGAAFQLIAAAGSFLLTGNAAPLKVSQASSVGGYSLTGITSSFRVHNPDTVGAFSLTGNAISFRTNQSSAVGAYALAGIAAPFKVTSQEGVGSFALTGIAQTARTLFVPATAAYTLTGIPIAPNGVGAFNLAGVAQTFRVIETNVFSSTVIASHFGFAALGGVPLGGGFTTILDPSFNLNSPSANLLTRLAASPGSYSLNGAPVSQVWQLNGLAGSFNLTGIAATFRTTWTGLTPGSYLTTFYGTRPNEQWAGRPDTPGIWTARVNDTGITVTTNADFMFSALGALALGQGIYNPQVYSEGWTVRPSSPEIWTPRVNDLAA